MVQRRAWQTESLGCVKESISTKSDISFEELGVRFFRRLFAAVTSVWTKDLSAVVLLYPQFSLSNFHIAFYF